MSGTANTDLMAWSSAQAATAEPGDDDSHYGASGEGFNFLDRWDAIESPMGKRDMA